MVNLAGLNTDRDVLEGDRVDVHVDPVAVPVQFVHVMSLNWRVAGKSALFDSQG